MIQSNKVESGSPVINNEKRHRFEMDIQGERAYIDYRFYKGEIVLMHTFVPRLARGKNIASSLAKFALEYIREHRMKLKVYCPFVAGYIKRHPEYEGLINGSL
jgi:uncharacterized protein